MTKSLSGWLLALTLCLPVATSLAQTREDARLITATQVLAELRNTPDQNVPAWLMERAYGVAVVPDVIKGAFIFGGRYGKGVMTVRDQAGRFGNPIFLTLTGGSVGWQIGGQSTDVVLVFATRRSVENFGRGKFTLGATASVAAGPVGRAGEAAGGKDAEVYAYSRNRGLFAGVALDGTALTVDNGTNRAFYGNEATTDNILGGKMRTNSESVRRFIAEVAASLPGGPGTTGTSNPPPVVTPTAPSAPTTAPAPAGAQAFPLEDSKPGSEPR
jgi:lipid-binding SYLF domain-containing protein